MKRDPAYERMLIVTALEDIAYYHDKLRYWLRDAEKWEKVWDDESKAALFNRQKHQTSDIDIMYTWFNSARAKDIQANGVWAHRKARSYAAAIAAEHARLQVYQMLWDREGKPQQPR